MINSPPASGTHIHPLPHPHLRLPKRCLKIYSVTHSPLPHRHRRPSAPFHSCSPRAPRHPASARVLARTKPRRRCAPPTKQAYARNGVSTTDYRGRLICALCPPCRTLPLPRLRIPRRSRPIPRTLIPRARRMLPPSVSSYLPLPRLRRAAPLERFNDSERQRYNIPSLNTCI